MLVRRPFDLIFVIHPRGRTISCRAKPREVLICEFRRYLSRAHSVAARVYAAGRFSSPETHPISPFCPAVPWGNVSVEISNPLATIRGARVSKGWGAILPELHLSYHPEIQNHIKKNNKLWYLSDPQTRIDDPSLWAITPIACTAAEYMRYYLSHEKVAGSAVGTMCCARFLGHHQQLWPRWQLLAHHP